MNKLVSKIIGGIVVAACGFIVGTTVAEVNERKENKTKALPQNS